jgi:hypothetical protein
MIGNERISGRAGHVADPASGPTARSGKRPAARRAVALRESAQDIALVGGELARSELLLGRQVDMAGMVAGQQSFVLNEPASKLAGDRLDPCAMVEAVAVGCDPLEVDRKGWHGRELAT